MTWFHRNSISEIKTNFTKFFQRKSSFNQVTGNLIESSLLKSGAISALLIGGSLRASWLLIFELKRSSDIRERL